MDDLKDEHKRLQKWGSKFAGADRFLRDEVELLKAELQRLYEADPSKSHLYVSKGAYELLREENDLLRKQLGELESAQGLSGETIRRLKAVSTAADEERASSAQRVAHAAEDVEKLKVQLTKSNRTAMQKQGHIQDLGARLSELQNRYDILGHHVLQLGEEKMSLIEALRERQSQLDFCLAQLQLLGRDAKALEKLMEKIRRLEQERDAMRRAYEEQIRMLRAQLEAALAKAAAAAAAKGSGGTSGGSQFKGLVSGSETISDLQLKKRSTGPRASTTSLPKLLEAKNVDLDPIGDAIKGMKDIVRHSGLVIHVRWHVKNAKHTFGTRHLKVDSAQRVLGWSRTAADSSKIFAIPFEQLKAFAYGYKSNLCRFLRRGENPPDCGDPETESGNTDDLSAPSIGQPKGPLLTGPRIQLVCCFTIHSNTKSYDFYAATEPETMDLVTRLGPLLKALKVEDHFDKNRFLAERGWSRLIEQCCVRQQSSRAVLLDGFERAGVFAATSGLGSGGGRRKMRLQQQQARRKIVNAPAARKERERYVGTDATWMKKGKDSEGKGSEVKGLEAKKTDMAAGRKQTVAKSFPTPSPPPPLASPSPIPPDPPVPAVSVSSPSPDQAAAPASKSVLAKELGATGAEVEAGTKGEAVKTPPARKAAEKRAAAKKAAEAKVAEKEAAEKEATEKKVAKKKVAEKRVTAKTEDSETNVTPKKEGKKAEGKKSEGKKTEGKTAVKAKAEAESDVEPKAKKAAKKKAAAVAKKGQEDANAAESELSDAGDKMVVKEAAKAKEVAKAKEAAKAKTEKAKTVKAKAGAAKEGAAEAAGVPPKKKIGGSAKAKEEPAAKTEASKQVGQSAKKAAGRAETKKAIAKKVASEAVAEETENTLEGAAKQIVKANAKGKEAGSTDANASKTAKAANTGKAVKSVKSVKAVKAAVKADEGGPAKKTAVVNTEAKKAKKVGSKKKA